MKIAAPQVQPLIRANDYVRIVITVVVLCFFGARTVNVDAQSLSSATTFNVTDGRILKNGVEFVAHGVNIDGPGWRWTHKTVADADILSKVWKFNLVRVNCLIQQGLRDTDPNKMDAIIDAYTSRGIVVIIDPHDHVGGYYSDPPDPANSPSLTDLVNWLRPLADRYKSNPYVWFEAGSSPGDHEEHSVSSQWMDMHQAVLNLIRTEAGARNIIVCDGAGRGSEDGNNGTLPVPDEMSAALTFGDKITKQYPNVVFGFHMDPIWCAGAEKLEDYISRVRAHHLALLITEYSMWSEGDTSAATETMMTVCRKLHVGRCAWHWTPGDQNHLVSGDEQPGGWQIDKKDGSKPTNLSWLGDQVWDDNHDLIPLHGPALDRTEWTATAFAVQGDSQNMYHMPDEAFSAYPYENNYWSSGMPQKPGQWFQVDMGAKHTFSRISFDARVHTGDFPRSYEIYVSNDGTSWGVPVSSGKNDQTVVRLSFPPITARYIRVVIGSAPTYHYWCIADFQAYAPITLNNSSLERSKPDRSKPDKFTEAAASNSAQVTTEVPLDRFGWGAKGNPEYWMPATVVLRPLDPTRDGWSTGREDAPGQSLTIDMQEKHKFNRIVLDAGKRYNDFPRGYEVYISDDGVLWGKPIKAGRGTPVTTITFPEQNARYIRIVQTRHARWTAWTVAQLRVYVASAAARTATLR